MFKKTESSYTSQWRGRDVHVCDSRSLPLMTLWLSKDNEVWLSSKTLMLLSKASMITQVCDLIAGSSPGILVLPKEFSLAFAWLESKDAPSAVSETDLVQKFTELATSAAARGDHEKAFNYFEAASRLAAKIEQELETARAMLEATAPMVIAAAME